MRLSIKHLRTNEWNHGEDEVPEGAEFGFWRIVEHTGAGWFPWPNLYNTKEMAENAMKRILKNGDKKGRDRH